MCRRRNGAAAIRARRNRARRGHAALDAAVPVRDPEVLRARRLRVARDHAQVVRERVHRGGRAAAVVDGRAHGQDLRRALVERGNPVRRRVGPLHARGGARPERPERREGVRRRVAGERVLMREARLARIDDRVVRGLVAVAAALDEVDALEIGAQHVSAAQLRLPARERGRPEDGGDGERDCAGGDQNDSLHDDSLLRLRLPDESSHRAVGFLGAGCYGAVSISCGSAPISAGALTRTVDAKRPRQRASLTFATGICE